MAADRRAQGRAKPLTAHQQSLVKEGTRASNQRRRWESGALGSERMMEAPAMLGTRMTPGQIYSARNWGEETQAETGHPRAYDRQLPGLEDPHALQTPPRWEDIPEEKQTDIARRVKARSGATHESMVKSFGSELDQSYMRAERHGLIDVQNRVRPSGQDFYTSGEPKQVIRSTSRDLGVMQQLVAAVHGDNSPKTPFKIISQETGETSYPQDVMSRSVISQTQEGVLPSEIERPPNVPGYNKNVEKSARRSFRTLLGGQRVGEAETSSPKTSAYTNSWLQSQPDFFTSDVHSGGGMTPHLSSSNPPLFHSDGTPKMKTETRGAGLVDVPVRDKSEREKAIATSGFHSMADFAARTALQSRGLGSLRQAQAAQWNEERVQRFGEHRSYDTSTRDKREEVPGQERLF